MKLKQGIVVASVVNAVCLGMGYPAQAYTVNAGTIYQQAKLQNQEYFRLLSRYDGAIDLRDSQGNTAYCLALKNNDKATLEFLAQNGANRQHKCVENIVVSRAEEAKASQRKTWQSKKFRTEDRFFNDDRNYLWAGAGVLATGGIIALAASSGGSGSIHDGKIDIDIPIGDEKPVTPSEPKGDLKDTSAAFFKTQEYTNSNFLEGIKAAEAYSHIYSQDEVGNVFGHQAGSDEAIKKIKVGVLDSGVYINKDLSGSVVKKYDINAFSKDASVWGLVASGVKDENGKNKTTEAYVIKKNGLYYLFHLHNDWDAARGQYVTTFEPVMKGDNNWGLSESDMNIALRQVWNASLDQFTLINSGAGNPGENLSGLVLDLNDENAIPSVLNTVGGLNHGTHVAGIIAANKNDQGMHGVAFDNAEILGASWDMSQNIYGTVKKMVDDGATVINNSWGDKFELGSVPPDPELYELLMPDVLDAYTYAAKNKAVWVQSTGNEGYSSPTVTVGLGGLDLSDRGYQKSDIEVPYLAVAALDYDTKTASAPSGYLASYSNACGGAAGYCLAAPGTEVLSTSATNSGHIYMSGTSMATPVVSGSIALLNGYYPWLNAQNIAYLLLETANKDGVYANSAIYGQGALDLEAAVTTPVGDLKLPEKASFDSLSSARLSKLSLSAPLQQKMLKAMPKTVTAFDVLNRPFQYDTNKLMNTTHASNANLRNEVSRMAMGGAKKVVKDEKSGFQFSSESNLNRGGQSGLAVAEVISETDAGTTRFYYAANSKYASMDNVLTTASNPYLAMNEAYGAENTFKLSDASKVKFSIQMGENGLYERDYEQDKHSFNERSYALSGEYSFNMTDYLEVAALGGMLFEDDAMLGMNGTGAFGINDSATYYMGVRAALRLTPEFSILAAYYRGYTQGSDSSMLAMSDLQTESFMLAGEYKFNKTDKVGLSLSSPLSVVKGRASVLYASGRDNASDTIYMQKLTTSLKPAAKEYDLGLYYQGQPKEDVNLMGKIQARFNVDGEKGVTDYIGIVGAGVAF
ncbi:MAG: S8 family serine peptidase [Acetobacter sp.]|nr:S8 family serine peptidase [Acetobacter sp.]